MSKSDQVSLSGKVVAITGGARGIGYATAKLLAGAGARVAIGDLDGDLTARAAAEIGPGVIGLPLDVTRRDSFVKFWDSVESQLGPIYGIVNNAGIMILGPFDEESEAVTRKMIDVNLYGVMTGTQLAMERLKKRSAGHIVNVASMAGKGGFPNAATYCATKHAVVGFSEAVRAELRDTGVAVSCVMPAVVNTELTLGLTTQARGIKNLEADDVARAIVRALREQHFDVFVPEALGASTKIMGLLPRTTRERIFRMMRGEDVLSKVDPVARAAYSERVGATKAR